MICRKWFVAWILNSAIVLSFASQATAAEVLSPQNASAMERLAAREVVRYVYLRTGKLPTLRDGTASVAAGIVVARKDRKLAGELATDLGPQHFAIKTVGGVTWIIGGDDQGTLYGAYRFAEKLGVRFYLHGDVIPDERLVELPAVNETGKPLFSMRGVNPWGSHPFGFDAWSADDYKAIFGQLAKMRMNFLGIHCYPEGHPYAEPTVWHGLAGDFDRQGCVKTSYVSRYFNTLLTPAWGDYRPKKTGEYSFGGSLLFDDEAWSPGVLRRHCPLPKSPEDCNEVFNRMGAQFRDAFAFAKQVGVKTCVGTEAPLIMPKVVRDRLKALGKNPADPAVVREVYEATFRRIMASHPLDYYWIWTPEDWTWTENKEAQYKATVADIKLAYEALKSVKAPFQLATAGWVLGPVHDRAAFDAEMPKDVPMSAISRNLGAVEVDPAFGRIAGREKWAIPWLESDGRQGLAGVQLWAGRMRRDAVDAAGYGCTGLTGLHWRTDILSPNVSALAQAAWDQHWKPAVIPAWQISGQIAAYPNAKISGTADEVLYRTCRYDLGTITLRAPNGKYKVTLKFCEPHFDSAGQRICDVRVQGKTVLTNVDIYAKVGKFAAIDYAFDDVAVIDGKLTIDLVARKSLPCISAIAVEGAGFSGKINCGGPAYKDWVGDDAAKWRNLPCDDFYADWAQANFGLSEAGKIFAAIDGRTPEVTDGGCPSGCLAPVATPWAQVAPQFAFVDEFERLRPQVKGAGNLDRFDYWLNTFKYLRALMRVRCAIGAKNPGEVSSAWTEGYTCLLASVSTPGGLAMVVNMENHPGWGMLVAKHSSLPWPKEYQGRLRIIVPTVRTLVRQQESLRVKFIVLDHRPPASVTVAWCPLGDGEFRKVSAQHIAGAVYEVALPPAAGSLEYRIEVATAAGESLFWPATAPTVNQTVVAW